MVIMISIIENSINNSNSIINKSNIINKSATETQSTIQTPSSTSQTSSINQLLKITLMKMKFFDSTIEIGSVMESPPSPSPCQQMTPRTPQQCFNHNLYIARSNMIQSTNSRQNALPPSQPQNDSMLNNYFYALIQSYSSTTFPTFLEE
ncbi:hypothetical protein Glove_132g130 [Diversispora epigaea]|uniref:Uncharacterized protein n=1 Tax=Diversispora epigaea TaxID=1348612 RepID=A0A397IXQ5_9GLOM|nr:hypothetical protein Glove_132g130 [Diversispora epigaea]